MSKYALDKANDIGAKNGWLRSEGYKGRIDAFRHAFWNALLAQKYNVEDAAMFTAGHEEQHPGDNALDTEMDTTNNAFGLSIITKEPNIAEAELIDTIVEEIASGQSMLFFSDWEKGEKATKLTSGAQMAQ